MKTKGQVGYEIFCEYMRWIRPEIKDWTQISSAKKDAWEAAVDTIALMVKYQYESRIEELEEQLMQHQKVITEAMERKRKKI